MSASLLSRQTLKVSTTMRHFNPDGKYCQSGLTWFAYNTYLRSNKYASLFKYQQKHLL